MSTLRLATRADLLQSFRESLADRRYRKKMAALWLAALLKNPENAIDVVSALFLWLSQADDKTFSTVLAGLPKKLLATLLRLHQDTLNN